MASFVPRTSAPSTDNYYYYDGNPFYRSGYGMPNCTAYAWGRFYEITNEYPRLSTANAENWWGYGDGYDRGQDPRLGAIMCWRKGVAGDGSDGAGHVAVVEGINADGSVITSESGWQDSRFWWTRTRYDNGNWGSGSAYTFQGFIYPPIDFDGGGSSGGGDSGGDGGGSTYPDDWQPPYITGNRYLDRDEMETNALYIWWYLRDLGWTINAVSAMLGNMETESTINPGIWQGLNEGNTSGGYGIVQWTPATKLIEWAEMLNDDYTSLGCQVFRIEYEVQNGLQYRPTWMYPETFEEFKKSTKDPYYLAMAFMHNYERPKNLIQPKRGEQAQKWYEFIMGEPAPEYVPSKVKDKGLPLLLMYIASKRKV